MTGTSGFRTPKPHTNVITDRNRATILFNKQHCEGPQGFQAVRGDAGLASNKVMSSDSPFSFWSQHDTLLAVSLDKS